MLHKYQQSIKNARNEKQPYFLTRKLAPITDDIFSQVPVQDSSYLLDSFVVADDEIVYESKNCY
jgi:hypothetical protein